MPANIVVPWISPRLSADLQRVFLRYGRDKEIKRGQIIVDETENSEQLIYLKSGLLQYSLIDYERNKSSIICSIQFPGSISGGTAYSSRQFAPARVTASKASEIKVLGNSEMNALLASDPELKCELLSHCCRGLKTVTDALLVIATMPAADRIRIFLASVLHWFGADISQEYVSAPVKFPRRFIKDATYISHITLDRIFGDWKREGVIRNGYRTPELRVADFMWAYNWLIERAVPNKTRPKLSVPI